MAAEVGSLELRDTFTSFTWMLDVDLLLSKKQEESISSACFTTARNHAATSEWRLQLYPNGINRKCRGYLSLYLRSTEQKNCSFMLRTVNFSITNSHDEELRSVDVEAYSTFNRDLWGIDKFLSRELLKLKDPRILKDGKLAIVCYIADIKTKARLCVQPTAVIPSAPPRPMPRTRSMDNLLRVQSDDDDDDDDSDAKESNGVMDDFEALLLGGRSDVTLLVGGRSFHAHRAVLAARSSVFASRFEQDKQQQGPRVHTSTIDMSKLKSELLKKLMRFVYLGQVDNLEESAHELIGPANEYALDELKVLCEQAMIKHLNVYNASDYLVLSFEHHAAKLQAHAMDFILDNSKDIMDTPGFQNMAGSHAGVIAAMFTALKVKQRSDSREDV